MITRKTRGLPARLEGDLSAAARKRDYITALTDGGPGAEGTRRERVENGCDAAIPSIRDSAGEVVRLQGDADHLVFGADAPSIAGLCGRTKTGEEIIDRLERALVQWRCCL